MSPAHLPAIEMSILSAIKNYVKKTFVEREKDPEQAYNRWADSYDSQPDNLMLALDEELFSTLLNDFDIRNTVIADIGCGTGRHWNRIYEQSPAKLIGYDVSEGMLGMLRKKFPQAETHQLTGNQLEGLKSNSCDLVISTLTIAHISNAEVAIKEWCRVLKPGGHLIITDYHPVALEKGAKRTFTSAGKTVAIVNHIHPIKKITAIAKQLQLFELRLIEKCIDETMKPFYEKQRASHIFEAWKGVPIIYGIHLKKQNDSA
jgi:ubiquinone/menaquinone biosynthesis C-methylase UbiE